MKRFAAVATLSLLALSACSEFTAQDRAMLKETHTIAVQAKETADKAAADARAASDAASKSAKSADKAFRQGQAK